MAEALLQVVLENLNSLIQREIGLLWGVDKELKKLSSTLSAIKALLEDAEMKQLQDKTIKLWLRKLKQATYDIDDVLDDCATEAVRLESKCQNLGSLDKVRSCFLTCYYPVDNVLFRYKVGNKMKEINENLDSIDRERKNFQLQVVVVANRVGIPEWRETISILTQPQVYGREKDKENIVEQLVKHASDCHDVSVLPILGMGGLGKTTLAQLVFNDPRITEHFEPRIWVCVSEDFEVKRVVKLILESGCGISCENSSSLDQLQKTLQDKLNGKRYLLVLDDVWNDNQEKWDTLRYILASRSMGASIISTTRLEKVALIMETLPICHLSGLSNNDCWSLFKQRAFRHEGEERPNLVQIGKEIVKKCGGVPLAAKALGSLMRFKKEESEWLCVKESTIWSLPQDEKCSIMPALRLSYHNLPLECRQCFAYCASFEKDSRIKKDRIIYLWMANGFISSNGRMELEDIGNEIWNELHWRSLFQELENDDFGNIESFKMHDLVHDLAQSIMEDECHVLEVERSNNKPNRSARHVTSVYDSKALENVESLRTLFVEAFSHDFMKFSTLRVLDASDTSIVELPSSIGNLIHLRYLNISRNYELTTLPKSLCTLINLQTLNLNDCSRLQRLPNQMRRLINIRHLCIEDCNKLTQMAPRIGLLTCLKTLSFFIVDRRSGFHLGELGGLNLGGKLRIEHLERVENWVDAREANLIRKKNLYSLGLCWGIESMSSLQENAKQVLEALQPHPNLKELIIEEYAGTSFSHWMMRDIPVVLQNLVSVTLVHCKNCQNLPPYGQLRFLKHLNISGMKYVKYIDDDDSDHRGSARVRKFPCLETVEIYDLPCLERWSREEEKDSFLCLSQLSIGDCPKLKLSYLPSLKDLQVEGCSDVLLSSISNLSCITSLVISRNDPQLSFPEGMLRDLTALQKLKVHSFANLVELPNELSNLSALKSLVIHDCDELESLPEQGLEGLNSLCSLDLWRCGKLKSLSKGLQHLKALESLTLVQCPELVSLPEGIKHLHSLRNLIIDSSKMVVLPEALQHVPALQSLLISNCEELTLLPDWLGNLASLQSLKIWYCPKVESLPDSIQSLTNLTTLKIKGYGELKRRCEKGRGEDWYKIQHIPDVRIKTVGAIPE